MTLKLRFTMAMKTGRGPIVLYLISLSLVATCRASGSLRFAANHDSLSVDSGSSQILECSLTHPSSLNGGSFSWRGPALVSGRTTISLDVYTGTVSKLTINNVSRSDEGTYSCSYPDLGTVSMTLTVNVNPHFLNVKSPQEFIEGTDAVVECPAYFGDPPGRMEWLHYHSIPITDDRYTLENGRMKIQNIQKDDEGVYRCIVRGMGNFYSKFITVVVLEWDELAPRIVEPNDTIEVAFGEPLDLLCQLKSLSSYGVVRYTWTVNTTLEQNHFHNTTPSFHTNAYQFRGGRYICRAENEYGYDEKVFHVRILTPPKPKNCSMDTRTCKAGQTVVLEQCPFTSPVQPSELEFQWSRDGEPVEIVPGGRFEVNHDGVLTITETRESDSGLYTVNISNAQGSALHMVQLQVLAPPTDVSQTTAPIGGPSTGSQTMAPTDEPFITRV